MERKFDWNAVAVAGVSSGVRGLSNRWSKGFSKDLLGDGFSAKVLSGTIDNFAAGTAASFMNMHLRDKSAFMTPSAVGYSTQGQVEKAKGGKMDFEEIFYDAFGNALGDSLGGHFQLGEMGARHGQKAVELFQTRNETPLTEDQRFSRKLSAMGIGYLQSEEQTFAPPSGYATANEPLPPFNPLGDNGAAFGFGSDADMMGMAATVGAKHLPKASKPADTTFTPSTKAARKGLWGIVSELYPNATGEEKRHLVAQYADANPQAGNFNIRPGQSFNHPAAGASSGGERMLHLDAEFQAHQAAKAASHAPEESAYQPAQRMAGPAWDDIPTVSILTPEQAAYGFEYRKSQAMEKNFEQSQEWSRRMLGPQMPLIAENPVLHDTLMLVGTAGAGNLAEAGAKAASNTGMKLVRSGYAKLEGVRLRPVYDPAHVGCGPGGLKVRVGKAANTATQLRNSQSTVTIGSDLQPASGSWLNAGAPTPVPAQVGDALVGRKFNSFDGLRSAIWEQIGNSSELSSGFSRANLAQLKAGNAPFAPGEFLADTGAFGERFNLHHINPISNGGSVYDLSNIQIVSPKTHFDIHYGPRN